MNVFQCTGLNDEDKYFMKACPARQGTTGILCGNRFVVCHFYLPRWRSLATYVGR
ncbi:hypothetical protein ABC733_23710 [Mangrovibacter sp. SLW1]